jgi:hypothetical protein
VAVAEVVTVAVVAVVAVVVAGPEPVETFNLTVEFLSTFVPACGF